MAELAALRAKLKDRQVKDGALGTTEESLCLDVSLLRELEELESERDDMNDPVGDALSMAGTRKPDLSEWDEKIEAKKAEIRANSIVVKFRSLASGKYEAIVNSFEEPDGADQKDFFDALTDACFLEASTGDGEKTDLTWAEIQPETSFGELDAIRAKVFVLNRRKQDIPFSLNPSGKTR